MTQKTDTIVRIQNAIEKNSFTLCHLIFRNEIFLSKVFKIRVVFGDKIS